MFKLYDSRLREVTEISPARPGQLRMCTLGPAAAGPADLTTMRALLLPDLIRRNTERHGLSVIACQRIPDDWAESTEQAFRADCTALNLLPPDFSAPASEFPAVAQRVLGDVIDIQTGDTDLPLLRARHRAHVGHLRFDGREIGRATGTVVTVADLAGRGLDPLAARLALLEYQYREQTSLTWDALAAADKVLSEWRELVAGWADEPSRPMSADYSSAVSRALDNDLDTPAALSALRELAADTEIPAGSKFETSAAADRVLGLDLVSMVGRVRSS